MTVHLVSTASVYDPVIQTQASDGPQALLGFLRLLPVTWVPEGHALESQGVLP